MTTLVGLQSFPLNVLQFFILSAKRLADWKKSSYFITRRVWCATILLLQYSYEGTLSVEVWFGFGPSEVNDCWTFEHRSHCVCCAYNIKIAKLLFVLCLLVYRDYSKRPPLVKTYGERILAVLIKIYKRIFKACTCCEKDFRGIRTPCWIGAALLLYSIGSATWTMQITLLKALRLQLLESCGHVNTKSFPGPKNRKLLALISLTFDTSL